MLNGYSPSPALQLPIYYVKRWSDLKPVNARPGVHHVRLVFCFTSFFSTEWSSRIVSSSLGIEAANCRSGYLVTNKLGATLVLRAILNLPIDEDAIPDPDPEVAFNMPETVREATDVKALATIEVEDLEAVQVENESGQALFPDGAALTRTLRIR